MLKGSSRRETRLLLNAVTDGFNRLDTLPERLAASLKSVAFSYYGVFLISVPKELKYPSHGLAYRFPKSNVRIGQLIFKFFWSVDEQIDPRKKSE